MKRLMCLVKGVDHIVMWNAASTRDLTSRAYSKVNEGNIYPTIFFNSPTYKQTANAGEMISININATFTAPNSRSPIPNFSFLILFWN